jgi:glycosyltransferase 2 family protein
LKKTRQLLIGVAITIGALYYTLRNVSMDELITSFKDIDLIYILPAIVLNLLSYVTRAYRWQILLRPFKRISISGIYAPLMIGFMGNILPARAGEFLRAYLVGKKHGITIAGAFSTIIIERLFDLIILLMLFVWVFVVKVDMFDPQLTFSGISVQFILAGFGKFCALLFFGLLSFIILLVYKEIWVKSCIGWFAKPFSDKRREKIFIMVGEFALGCKIIKDPSALAKIIIITTLTWFLIIAVNYPLYFAFDLQDKSLESLLLLTIMICVLITIIPTPGFLGSFNAGVLIALHEIRGEAEVTAVSFGMVAWAVGFIVLIGGGLFFIFKDHMSVKSLMKAEGEVQAGLEQTEPVKK